MKKVKVEICCGTACYVLGAAKLVNLEAEMPADWKERVEIRAVPCLNLCESENLGGAPFVRLNDNEIMAEAGMEKLRTRIAKLLAGKDD